MRIYINDHVAKMEPDPVNQRRWQSSNDFSDCRSGRRNRMFDSICDQMFQRFSASIPGGCMESCIGVPDKQNRWKWQNRSQTKLGVGREKSIHWGTDTRRIHKKTSNSEQVACQLRGWALQMLATAAWQFLVNALIAAGQRTRCSCFGNTNLMDGSQTAENACKLQWSSQVEVPTRWN